MRRARPRTAGNGASREHPPSGTRQLSRPSRRSALLLLTGAALGLLHQADHILRYDHSGWPFRPEVSLFTFSWVFFTLGLAPLVMRRPWLRLLPVALVLVGVQAAHVFIETPHDQYSVWATGVSHDPGTVGEPNLLGIMSPLLGSLAAGVSIAISVCFLAALTSLTADARLAHRPVASS